MTPCGRADDFRFWTGSRRSQRVVCWRRGTWRTGDPSSQVAQLPAPCQIFCHLRMSWLLQEATPPCCAPPRCSSSPGAPPPQLGGRPTLPPPSCPRPSWRKHPPACAPWGHLLKIAVEILAILLLFLLSNGFDLTDDILVVLACYPGSYCDRARHFPVMRRLRRWKRAYVRWWFDTEGPWKVEWDIWVVEREAGSKAAEMRWRNTCV